VEKESVQIRGAVMRFIFIMLAAIGMFYLGTFETVLAAGIAAVVLVIMGMLIWQLMMRSAEAGMKIMMRVKKGDDESSNSW